MPRPTTPQFSGMPPLSAITTPSRARPALCFRSRRHRSLALRCGSRGHSASLPAAFDWSMPALTNIQLPLTVSMMS